MSEHDYAKAKQGPSRMGYRRGCRCLECVEAGQAYLAARRVRDRRRKSIKDPEKVTTHGIGGYQRGCRCTECVRAARDARPRDEPSVDWSDIEHLKPGAGVRRRSA